MTRAIRCQLGSCKWNHELTCTSREPIELEYTNTDEILEIDEAEEAELKEFLVCKNYTEVENKQELEQGHEPIQVRIKACGNKVCLWNQNTHWKDDPNSECGSVLIVNLVETGEEYSDHGTFLRCENFRFRSSASGYDWVKKYRPQDVTYSELELKVLTQMNKPI